MMSARSVTVAIAAARTSGLPLSSLATSGSSPTLPQYELDLSANPCKKLFGQPPTFSHDSKNESGGVLNSSMR